jgi:hypothetical protein
MLWLPSDYVADAASQSNEIIDLVAMIGLGDGNRSAAGRLRNDVRRSLKSVFSSKTRDKLKNTEQRMAVGANCLLCCFWNLLESLRTHSGSGM